MTEQLEKLVAAHPVLARSIVDGAIETMAELLTDPRWVPDSWLDKTYSDDGDQKRWEGPHVADLCREIEDEIRRRCAGIAGGAK